MASCHPPSPQISPLGCTPYLTWVTRAIHMLTNRQLDDEGRETVRQLAPQDGACRGIKMRVRGLATLGCLF